MHKLVWLSGSELLLYKMQVAPFMLSNIGCLRKIFMLFSLAELTDELKVYL